MDQEWIARFREDARAKFDAARPEKQRIRLDIDLDAALAAKPPGKAALPQHVKKLIADKSKIVVYQSDNRLTYVNVPKHLSKQGVVAAGFDEAMQDSDIAKYFMDRIVKPDDSRLAAFNCAFFSAAVFVYVPKNTVLSEPVNHIFMSSGGSTIDQVFVIAAENSSLTVAEQCLSKPGKNAFHSRVSELRLEEGSSVNYLSMQDFSQSTDAVAVRKAILGEGAKLGWMTSTTGARYSRTVRDTILAGRGAEARDVEVFFGDKSQMFDITSNVRHAAIGTRANVLIKGILRDSAKAVSQGMIKIDKNAQKTDSFLAEHTLMLDPEASSDAVPGLEIEANDVRATHSASTGQADKEQIFYLVSRGLGHAEAKKLIALGFLESAFQKMPPATTEYFKSLVENKWRR